MVKGSRLSLGGWAEFGEVVYDVASCEAVEEIGSAAADL